MHGGLVDQSEKFKKRVASQTSPTYRVVYTNELVVGFPIDEGVLGFQTKYSAAVVSPAYGIWKLRNDPQRRTFHFSKDYLRSGEARKIYLRKCGVPLPAVGAYQRRFLGDRDSISAHREQGESCHVLVKANRSAVSVRIPPTHRKARRSVFLEMFGDPRRIQGLA